MSLVPCDAALMCEGFVYSSTDKMAFIFYIYGFVILSDPSGVVCLLFHETNQ